jgi:hypothetical protein
VSGSGSVVAKKLGRIFPYFDECLSQIIDVFPIPEEQVMLQPQSVLTSPFAFRKVEVPIVLRRALRATLARGEPLACEQRIAIKRERIRTNRGNALRLESSQNRVTLQTA